jgi:hypothetical protein
MKIAPLFSGITTIGAIVAFAGSVSAQDEDIGKIEFQSNCASCHGIGAKGDGPMSGELKRRPADLTVLAKKNNGVFPLNSVYRINRWTRCDCQPRHSRNARVGISFCPHQNTSIRSLATIISTLPPNPPGPVVHGRILAVIDYLSRIQEK